MSDGKCVVVTGPSGAGKSTILRAALERTGARFSVSATTRSPRAGETHGRDYLFLSREQFEEMIARGELLEWAEVFGHYYGTPAGPVREAVARGETIVLDIDVQGGIQVHEKAPEATFVLIVPPSMEVLERRLRERGTEDARSLRRRLAKARSEIEQAEASGVYDRRVVNDDLDRAVDEMVSIIDKEP